MRIFVFLHVLTMFAAVAASFGPRIVLRRAAQTGNVPTIRAVFRMAQPVGQAIPFLFVAGAILGLVAVFTNAFTPWAPWLLIGYVLFIVAMIIAARVTAPWMARVGTAAGASPDDAPSTELAAAIGEPLQELTYWIDYAVVTALIFDMIVKPFS
jgi:hypothetical protein